MNNPFPPHFSPPNPTDMAPARNPRLSDDFRGPRPANGLAGSNGNGNGNGPLPAAGVPVPHGRMGNGAHPGMRAALGFDGPRSPPNSKNTSHVPCKFYRQGTCQAGKACPFMHADAVTPCKYYQKGNCKFGMRCANEHIMQDGRRVNRPGPYTMGGGPLNLGGRVIPPPNPELGPGSSLLSMQHAGFSQHPGMGGMSDSDFMASSPTQSKFGDIPIIDTTISSHPGSNYGSPPADGRLPTSPIQKGLSVLDAPLPASFDSQGISHMARYGPIAASVPSRFGFDVSPPSSLPSRTIGDNSTLRNLHNSAFGEDSRNGKDALGSSPPAVMEVPIGRPLMHSERYAKTKIMSSSLGARAPIAINDDWDDNFPFEDDLVPNSLHDDILTPQERMRRYSRNGEDELSRQSLQGFGSPGDSSAKVGSPSRFGALFSRSHRADSGESLPGVNAFGHVGSPLRNSPLNPGTSPSIRAMPRPTSGDVSPYVSSPPRQASMSIISQQLQRTRLSSRASETSENGGSIAPSFPGISRVASGGANSASGTGRLDRAVSSNSVSRAEKIVEEEDDLFSMDDMAPKENGKRYSGGVWSGYGKASPSLGAVGGQKQNGDKGSLNPWGNGS